MLHFLQIVRISHIESTYYMKCCKIALRILNRRQKSGLINSRIFETSGWHSIFLAGSIMPFKKVGALVIE